MKVIFLDFDGVLNTPVDYANLQAGMTITTVSMPPLRAEKVALLNDLVERTGAKVVLSTAWRFEGPAGWPTAWLKAAGFKGEVVGRTPKGGGPTYSWGDGGLSRRSAQIGEWLSGRDDVEAYVIIDDCDDAIITGRTVLTNDAEGLTADDVNLAAGILISDFKPQHT